MRFSAPGFAFTNSSYSGVPGSNPSNFACSLKVKPSFGYVIKLPSESCSYWDKSCFVLSPADCADSSGAAADEPEAGVVFADGVGLEA